MTTDVAVTSPAQTEDTTFTYNHLRSTTSKFSLVFPSSYAGDTVIRPIITLICVFGFVANLAMLTCLLMYKQGNKKTMNIFILNQTLLDLVVVFFAIIKLAIMASGYLKVKTGVMRIVLKHDGLRWHLVYH